MSLWMRMQGLSNALPLRDVTLTRALGEPVRWTFTAHVVPERRGSDEVRRISEILEAGPVIAHGFVADMQLGKAATIAAANFQSSPSTSAADASVQDAIRSDLLTLDAVASAPEQSSDAFIPRRRVHRSRNLLILLREFDHVAHLSQAVTNHLQGIEFPDADSACIIQDGVSDWDFVHRILCQYDLLETNARRKPLTVFGSVDEKGGTDGKWTINWAIPQAYDDLSELSERRIHFSDSANDSRTLFGSLSSERRPQFASGLYPTVLQQVYRTFTLDDWHRWSRRDVPLFWGQKDAFVWKVSDRLFDTNDPDLPIGWSTTLFIAPKDEAVGATRREVSVWPWLGLGFVKKTTATGPWITVSLPGFENDYDHVNVRLSTLSTGNDGTKGLHIVPDENTKVLLAWSGYLNESVICMGNVRQRAAELDAPSIWLDNLAAHLGEVDGKHIGPIRVRSSLDMKVDDPLMIKANGTDVEMKGGIFYTGR